MDSAANALDRGLARCDPALYGLGAAGAAPDHRRGKTALGIADGVASAIQRQPIEIIGDRNIAGGGDNAIEAEERTCGEVGARDVAN